MQKNNLRLRRERAKVRFMAVTTGVSCGPLSLICLKYALCGETVYTLQNAEEPTPPPKPSHFGRTVGDDANKGYRIEVPRHVGVAFLGMWVLSWAADGFLDLHADDLHAAHPGGSMPS